MKRRWTLCLLLALCMSLALVGAALAQDVEPSFAIPEPPDPPKAVVGLYVTSEDNVGDGGTGVADGDMDASDPPPMCPQDPRAPIEFNIVVGEEVCSAGQLTLAAYDFGSGLHEVYVNGHFVGLIPSQGDEWEVLQYAVPQAVLTQGANLVEVLLVEDCGLIAWGALEIEPCEEEFVPESGTVVLLGSGLAGLAGYAALRWRSRE